MKKPLLIWRSGLSTMRLPFYCFLLLLFPFLMQAQRTKKACGVYHKPVNESSVNRAIDLVDQFGNGYSLDELNIERFKERNNEGSRNASNCTGGDFVLEFVGFTCDEETTICNVFQELSGLIDIGPNGSNPLITVVKEPFQNDDGSNDTETLGVGVTFFQPECGIANNFIFDVMYTDITLATGTVSGVLRINSLLPFYNDVQGPVSGHYDLHTVALHEALHILGYSSLISNGGGSVSGYYSRWDTYLYSENDLDSLIALGDNGPIGCCDFSVFNPSLEYNQVITADCNMDIFFRDDNDQNIARTYGVDYPVDNPGGLLSHLDRCGAVGDPFVMKAELDTEEEKDLTQEEIDILFALGYQADGGATECNVIANNDQIVIATQDLTSLVPYAQIFDNDALPDGFDPQTDVIYHTSGCGTTDNFPVIFIFPEPNNLSVRAPSCVTFDLCYTIIGCDGECDDGIITIDKLCTPCTPLPPLCPPADICAGENLFCYGDFEIFIPQTFGGGTQPPTFNLSIPNCPSIEGTPDVVYDQDDDNRMLGLTNTEVATIPLSTPVQPGCTIDISYRYAKNTSNTTTVNFIGTSESFCDLNQIPACPGTNCVASVMTSLGMGTNAFTTPCDNTSPPDIDCDCAPFLNLYNVDSWATINTTSFVNNTTEPINFIQISPLDEGIFTYHLIDDLVITADCDNVVNITVDTPVDVCHGQEATVAVTVCIEGTNTTPNDVTLTANLPNLIGANITAGSAFDGGSATIPNTIAGAIGSPNCYTVDFDMEVSYNIAIGSQIDINFEAIAANACPDLNSVMDAQINVIACDIPCVLESYPTITASCGNDGSIEVIVAGGSGNYTYQWSGGLGNTASVSGLAPGTYELMVTDATDASCFIREEFIVLAGDDCTTGCEGDGTIEIEHKVVQILCLESEPGVDRYYIDMYIPNWGNTQNNNFEICSEDIFVTTPGVILESNESFIIPDFPALNIFMIIQVPIGTPIDQGICFETPVCIDAGQVCGEFCVTGFPVCPEEGCDFEVVADISLTPTGTTCNSLTGNDLYMANVALQIQGVSGVNLDYVQYSQVTGNGDPNFWQQNNVPQTGGVATLQDQAMCWKSYDSQYFCFKITIGYSIGEQGFVCEKDYCLIVDDLLNGGGNDGTGERRDLGLQNDRNGQSIFPVFPNPVSQELRVQNPQKIKVQLELIAMHGSLLSKQSLPGAGQAKINVSNYPPGVYLLRIRDVISGAILQMDKVIITH